MSARKLVLPLVGALPWLIVAVLVWAKGIERDNAAGVLVAVAVTMAINEDRARVRAETQYIVAVRHAMEEATREAQGLDDAERAAVLKTARRIGRLTDGAT